jgi:hypothetical protein
LADERAPMTPSPLRFAYSGPSTSPYLQHAFVPWADQMMKDSEGKRFPAGLNRGVPNGLEV